MVAPKAVAGVEGSSNSTPPFRTFTPRRFAGRSIVARPPIWWSEPRLVGSARIPTSLVVPTKSGRVPSESCRDGPRWDAEYDPNGMSIIFINYRRDDSAGQTGRLFDRLAARFGPNRVFIDVSMEGGVDFEAAIEAQIASAGAQLVVIGPQWLTITDKNGRPRLHAEDDLVRREIAIALKQNIRVIPVLVRGAEMPPRGALPEDIQALAKRHAVRLSDPNWDSDIRTLIDQLARALGEGAVAPADVSADRGPAPEVSAPSIPEAPARRFVAKRWALRAIRVALRIAAVYAYVFVALFVMFGLIMAHEESKFRWPFLLGFATLWGVLHWVLLASTIGVRGRQALVGFVQVVAPWAMAWGLMCAVLVVFDPSETIRFVSILLVGICGPMGSAIVLRQRYQHDEPVRREVGLLCFIWLAALGGPYVLFAVEDGWWSQIKSFVPSDLFGPAWLGFIVGSGLTWVSNHCWRSGRTVASILRGWAEAVRTAK
jgi:hypothetical protein